MGAAAINALCIATAIPPIGAMALAMASEAFIVSVTKLRKAVFH